MSYLIDRMIAFSEAEAPDQHPCELKYKRDAQEIAMTEVHTLPWEVVKHGKWWRVLVGHGWWLTTHGCLLETYPYKEATARIHEEQRPAREARQRAARLTRTDWGLFGPFHVNGRFEVGEADCPDDGGAWAVIDRVGGTLLQWPSQRQAIACARFARAYVRKHGDIDLSAFPYSLDDRLSYSEDTIT